MVDNGNFLSAQGIREALKDNYLHLAEELGILLSGINDAGWNSPVAKARQAILEAAIDARKLAANLVADKEDMANIMENIYGDGSGRRVKCRAGDWLVVTGESESPSESQSESESESESESANVNVTSGSLADAIKEGKDYAVSGALLMRLVSGKHTAEDLIDLRENEVAVWPNTRYTVENAAEMDFKQTLSEEDWKSLQKDMAHFGGQADYEYILGWLSEKYGRTMGGDSESESSSEGSA